MWSTQYVRFLYDPERLLVVDYRNMKIMNFNGEVVQKFEGNHHLRSPIFIDDSLVASGNKNDKSVHISDTLTGKTLGKFYHHSSEGFSGFAYHKESQTLCCVNLNGKLYVLKNTPK